MADQLQALLDKINNEGIKKTEAEKEQMLKQAKDEAARIVKEAEEKAAQIKADANKDAALQLTKGQESLRQAARDILLSLREQLKSRVLKVAKTCIGQTMKPEMMAEIIQSLAKAYAEGGNLEQIDTLLSAENADKLKSILFTGLLANLKENSNLSPVPYIEGGFKLSFNGEDVVFDFTDEALAEAMAGFLNPKLAEILQDN